jgi:muramidase (phage lysozyme)
MSDPISPNARRWLNLLSYAEGTWGGSAPRYDITFGYKPIKDLSRHPNQVVHGGKYSSAAAGAYQIMPDTWAGVAKQQGLKDFGPRSQDIAALALIRAKGVNPDRDPITKETVAKLSGTWASLPTIQGKSAYGQPVKSFESLHQFAEKQGATTAATPKPTSQQAAAPKNSGLGIGLLNKFIDMMGVMGGRGFGQRSALPTPEMPDYSESSVSPAQQELGIILDAYKGRQNTEQYQQAVEQDLARNLQSNVAAAEAAKAELLAQALGAFGAPSSVI